MSREEERPENVIDRFTRRIVKRKQLEADVDEVTLECGHEITRIIPPLGETNFCSICFDAWILEEKARNDN